MQLDKISKYKCILSYFKQNDKNNQYKLFPLYGISEQKIFSSILSTFAFLTLSLKLLKLPLHVELDQL